MSTLMEFDFLKRRMATFRARMAELGERMRELGKDPAVALVWAAVNEVNGWWDTVDENVLYLLRLIAGEVEHPSVKVKPITLEDLDDYERDYYREVIKDGAVALLPKFPPRLKFKGGAELDYKWAIAVYGMTKDAHLFRRSYDDATLMELSPLEVGSYARTIANKLRARHKHLSEEEFIPRAPASEYLILCADIEGRYQGAIDPRSIPARKIQQYSTTKGEGGAYLTAHRRSGTCTMDEFMKWREDDQEKRRLLREGYEERKGEVIFYDHPTALPALGDVVKAVEDHGKREGWRADRVQNTLSILQFAAEHGLDYGKVDEWCQSNSKTRETFRKRRDDLKAIIRDMMKGGEAEGVEDEYIPARVEGCKSRDTSYRFIPRMRLYAHYGELRSPSDEPLKDYREV